MRVLGDEHAAPHILRRCLGRLTLRLPGQNFHEFNAQCSELTQKRHPPSLLVIDNVKSALNPVASVGLAV